MANICDYNLSVVGPREDIVAISELLLPALADVSPSPYAPVILELGRLPSLGDVTHKWIGVTRWINSEGKWLDWEKTVLPRLFGEDGEELEQPAHSVVCVWKDVVSSHRDTLDADTLDTLTQLGIKELLDVPAQMSEVEQLLSVAKTLGIEEEVSRRWQNKGRLEIGGEAKWGPPDPFAQALSRLWPNCGFRCSGTTEHEVYDDWIYFAGEGYPITVVVEDIRTGEKWWDVRDGVEYDPPEYEYDPDYDDPYDDPEYAGV
jgi:hypothetical protein